MKQVKQDENGLNLIIDVSEEKSCRMCGAEFDTFRQIGSHIGAKHKISVEKYFVEHFLNGKHPKCPICNEDTRYQKGKHMFRKYCVKHKNHARSEWSKIYGFGANKANASWKKGLTKETHSGIAAHSEKVSGKGNPNALTEEQYMEHLKKIAKHGFNVLCSYEDYQANHYRLKTQCQKCNHVFKKHSLGSMLKQIHLDSPIRCNKCNPFGCSIPESEVYSFIVSLGIEEEKIQQNYRGFQKELDIYIPEKKFAVEYNGLYWHSQSKKGAHFHMEKSDICKENGINLFHIFSDEWRDKSEIIKSMIRCRLGMLENKVFARQCEVEEIKSFKQKEFFNQNHLEGNAKSIKCFTLAHNNETVMALSLRMPKNKYQGRAIEIARSCSKLNTSVVGGFSKLLSQAKKWAKDNKFDTIFTFADYRFSTGQTYIKNGFELERFTLPSYWISNGIQRIDRSATKGILQYREAETLKEAKMFKVYNCGNWLFKLSLSEESK